MVSRLTGSDSDIEPPQTIGPIRSQERLEITGPLHDSLTEGGDGQGIERSKQSAMTEDVELQTDGSRIQDGHFNGAGGWQQWGEHGLELGDAIEDLVWIERLLQEHTTVRIGQRPRSAMEL